MQRRVRVQPRFYGFLLVILLLCFLVSFLVAQAQYTKVSGRLASLNNERSALATRVGELTQRLEYVRSDAYIERVARDELGMLRKGEIRYVTNR